MTDALLALNAGSSSLKFSLFDLEQELISARALARGAVTGFPHASRSHITDASGTVLEDQALDGIETHEGALAHVLAWIDRTSGVALIAAGHRVVHGGTRYVQPTILDESVIAQLRALVPLAPLHQQHNVAAMEAFRHLHPRIPQVACFDTAFHHEQPAVATQFALPRNLASEGIRRYGFHGLSYEYIASVLPHYLAERADGRIVVAHLGSGASMCAMRERRSVATTMGFSALDGLPMGTRCGAMDPGVLLYLLERGMSPADLRDLLWERSGLLGVSGLSADMRDLLASTEVAAVEAVALFVYRIVRELGSLAAALGGLDALIFTAGIGEHAPAIRAAVCEQVDWLGVVLDRDANNAGATRISAMGSRVTVLIIPTDEEGVLAQHTARTLGLSSN